MPSILDWTDDGFSTCFGVNHLGHFLLTNLLLPRLKECAPSRVITLTCSSYKYQKLDFQDLNYNLLPFFTYCRSKLANIYFSQELARITEGKGVTSYAVHPGETFLMTLSSNLKASDTEKIEGKLMIWMYVFVFHCLDKCIWSIFDGLIITLHM